MEGMHVLGVTRTGERAAWPRGLRRFVPDLHQLHGRRLVRRQLRQRVPLFAPYN